MFFCPPQIRSAVKEPTGIVLLYTGAMPAPRLKTATAHLAVMATFARKKPAIVQNKHGGNVLFRKIIHQHGEVYKIPVQNAQQHYIGLDFVHKPQQFFGAFMRKPALFARHARQKPVQFFLRRRTDLKTVGVCRRHGARNK